MRRLIQGVRDLFQIPAQPDWNELGAAMAKSRSATDTLDALAAEVVDTADMLWRLLDDLPEFLCIAYVNGDDIMRFRRVSPRSVEILGYQPSEMEGRPIFDFIHPDDIVPTMEVVVGLNAASIEDQEFSNRYRCKDGSWRQMRWVASQLVEFDGVKVTAASARPGPKTGG